MAVTIVCLFEVVYVDHRKAERPAGARRPCCFQFKLLLQVSVIYEPCQAVMHHQSAQFTIAIHPGGNGRNHLRWCNRLGQKFVSSVVHRQQLTFEVVFHSKKHDRYAHERFGLTDHLCNLVACATRKIHIHEHQIRIEFVHYIQNRSRISNDLAHH